MKNLRMFGLSIIFASSLGCSSDSLVDVASQSVLVSPISNANGAVPNGAKVNGAKVNGAKVNGAKVNGTLVQTLQNISASNATLVGLVLETGAILSGANFTPARLYASLADGSVATVQVSNWTPLSLPNLPVMDTYLVSDPSTGDSICGLDSSGNLVYAAPMSGTFDPSSGARISTSGLFTFACRFAALQKCNEYGYPDWITRQETYGSAATRTVNNYHDACVRMVRADYCGDGLTHTYDGTTIDIYDNLNFNAKETSDIGTDGFYFEAEWATDGAWCINKTRWMPSALAQSLTLNRSLVNPDWTYIQTHCPERIAGNPWPNNPSGNSAPRPCDSLSNYNASVGFSMDQSKRSLLRNNSKLYQY